VTEAVRIEGENLFPGGNYECSIRTAVPEFIDYTLREYFGLGKSYNPEPTTVPTADRASCNKRLRLGSNQHFATKFNGNSDKYDVIYGYLYKIDNVHTMNGSIRIGENDLPFTRYFRNDRPLREVLARNITIKRGDPIVVAMGENGTGTVDLDFLEFVPTWSASNRPSGISLSWRYWEFYSWIYYDDMNVHFFIVRFPVSFFLLILFSYLLFGRTPGNILQDVYVVGQNGSLHFGHYLLRTLALCFLPFWGVFYAREDRLLTDVVSGSKVIVRRVKRE
jgi:hypothetical protein